MHIALAERSDVSLRQQALHLQRCENAGVERVACTHGVDDRHLLTRHRDLEILGIAVGTIRAARDDHKLGTVVQPMRGKCCMIMTHAEPFKILVGEFDDVRERGHALDARHMGLLVLDEPGADVGVERDDALVGLARQQRLVGVAAGIGDQADRPEMHGLAIVAELRQIGARDHAAGRVLVVEGIGRGPVDQLDERDRRRARGDRGRGIVDSGGGQRFAQHIAQHVIGKAGEEGRRHAEAAERNCSVEDRAAGVRRIGVLAERCRSRQHVDQRFATAKDHGLSPRRFFNRFNRGAARSQGPAG